MTLSQWQAEVARFVAEYDLEASETSRMLISSPRWGNWPRRSSRDLTMEP